MDPECFQERSLVSGDWELTFYLVETKMFFCISSIIASAVFLTKNSQIGHDWKIILLYYSVVFQQLAGFAASINFSKLEKEA